MTDKELLKWIEENKPASDGGYIVPVEWMREWFKSAPFMKEIVSQASKHKHNLISPKCNSGDKRGDIVESIYDTLARYYEALEHISTMACGFDCYEEQAQCHRMKAIAQKAIEPVDEVIVASPIYHPPMKPSGHYCTCMPGQSEDCPYCNPKDKRG